MRLDRREKTGIFIMMATGIQNRLFTVSEYERLYETGILSPKERTELIEGEIFTMAPIGTRHGRTVTILTKRFIQALGDKAITSVQNSITISDLSEPQPDIVLLEYRADFYKYTKPSAQNVILVIEVSDSSLRYDTRVKGPLYARHGIPEYWVVDLTSDSIFTYQSPGDDGYAVQKVYGSEENVNPAAFEDIGIAVKDIV